VTDVKQYRNNNNNNNNRGASVADGIFDFPGDDASLSSHFACLGFNELDSIIEAVA
jgi:hypothetical protein